MNSQLREKFLTEIRISFLFGENGVLQSVSYFSLWQLVSYFMNFLSKKKLDQYSGKSHGGNIGRGVNWWALTPILPKTCLSLLKFAPHLLALYTILLHRIVKHGPKETRECSKRSGNFINRKNTKIYIEVISHFFLYHELWHKKSRSPPRIIWILGDSKVHIRKGNAFFEFS